MAIKKNEVDIYILKWKDVKGILMRKIRKSQNYIYIYIVVVWGGGFS